MDAFIYFLNSKILFSLDNPVECNRVYTVINKVILQTKELLIFSAIFLILVPRLSLFLKYYFLY